MEREISRLDRIVTRLPQIRAARRPGDESRSPPILLLEEAKLFLAPQLEKQNIRVVQEPAEPLNVNVDPAQMQQVLINLVQNAADSIERDGTITLRTRLSRKPLANGTGGTVILEVSDTGKGISPEGAAADFSTPFFTTKESGTGLGLSIAARIVGEEARRAAAQFQSPGEPRLVLLASCCRKPEA